jgi:hypothetical protein
MREDPRHVSERDAWARGVERGNRLLVEKMAEKRRLGEKLDIDEVRPGLKRNRPEPLGAMQPAR